MNPEQWLSLKWNGGSTMSDRWLNQSKIIHTEITHSEMYPDGKVKVYIETPDETGGFHDAICWLPDYTWEVHGYSESEMMYFKQLIRDNAHLIIEFSQEGGILNAANI